MASEQSDIISSSPTIEVPNFMTDLMNVILSTFIVIMIWYLFFLFYDYFFSLGLLGLVILFVVILFLLPYTINMGKRWFEIWGYKIVSWRTGVPYMNYRTKCPFLQRKFFTFSCRAEQIEPFNEAIFEKCHKEIMWEACWPERIPSILQMYDEALPKEKQRFAFILAAMKEHASPAGMKMHEVLTDDSLELEARVSAGYALEEMRNESGIEPLIAMVGQYDQRTDQMIRAILARYKEMAIPHLIDAVQNCEGDTQCGMFVEIMGKIGHENSIPTLENLLTSDTIGEYTKLQTIYAFQEIGTTEAFRILIAYLEKASDEEQTIIKQACLNRKLISFPLLIDLLSNREITEEYYAQIGDILAGVDARTYDQFFTKIGELQGSTVVQSLATTLKENTPDEEEFLKIHEVFDKHIGIHESPKEF